MIEVLLSRLVRLILFAPVVALAVASGVLLSGHVEAVGWDMLVTQAISRDAAYDCDAETRRIVVTVRDNGPEAARERLARLRCP